MPARRAAAFAATLVCVLTVSACSSSPKPRRTITKFVDPPSSVSSSASTPSASSPTSGPPPPPPKSLSALSGRCDGKLPLSVVGPAIDESLPGRTAFVVGTPDASIHRVSYINCQYGLAGEGATPAVEIQVSLYGTAEQAAARIGPTVSDYKQNGATATRTNADGIPAFLLTGGTGAGYDSATVVLAFGQRTVAVSVSNEIPADKQAEDLTKLAALAVSRTQ